MGLPKAAVAWTAERGDSHGGVTFLSTPPRHSGEAGVNLVDSGEIA